MFSKFVRNNIPLVSIIIFVLLFIIIIFTKPSLVFDKNGKPREFGLIYRNKNSLPYLISYYYMWNIFHI